MTGRILFPPEPTRIYFHPQITGARFALPVTLEDVYSWASGHQDPSNGILLQDLELSRSWDSSSGGEKQRLLLSALLASSPKSNQHDFELLLLDEPTNHLDAKSRTQVIKEVSNWVQSPKSNRAAVIVTHDPLTFSGLTNQIVFEMKEIP